MEVVGVVLTASQSTRISRISIKYHLALYSPRLEHKNRYESQHQRLPAREESGGRNGDEWHYCSFHVPSPVPSKIVKVSTLYLRYIFASRVTTPTLIAEHTPTVSQNLGYEHGSGLRDSEMALLISLAVPSPDHPLHHKRPEELCLCDELIIPLAATTTTRDKQIAILRSNPG